VLSRPAGFAVGNRRYLTTGRKSARSRPRVEGYLATARPVGKS